MDREAIASKDGPFGDAAGGWRWVPRFEHLLIDRTQASAETVPGALAARLAQIALMAAFRDGLLEQATRLMGELYRAAGFEEVAKHVEYVLATQSEENRQVFAEALLRSMQFIGLAGSSGRANTSSRTC